MHVQSFTRGFWLKLYISAKLIVHFCVFIKCFCYLYFNVCIIKFVDVQLVYTPDIYSVTYRPILFYCYRPNLFLYRMKCARSMFGWRSVTLFYIGDNRKHRTNIVKFYVNNYTKRVFIDLAHCCSYTPECIASFYFYYTDIQKYIITTLFHYIVQSKFCTVQHVIRRNVDSRLRPRAQFAAIVYNDQDLF